MAPLTQNGGSFARQGDPNAILNECRDVDRGIDEIEMKLNDLRKMQQRSLDDPDSSMNSPVNRQLDAAGAETMTAYRSLAARIKAIKQQPESGSPKNAPQVGKVDRKLKSAINQYQNLESDFRKKLQAQMARQYRIVRPNASEAEVREAVEDTSNQQVFSQALLQSDRRGQSQAALAAVESRHAAIQKIEGQMIELAELFQDMEALVVQQEAAVTIIEQKGEEVVENMDQGNQQIGTAIVSARARNRKKWWCLLIVGMFLTHSTSIFGEHELTSFQSLSSSLLWWWCSSTSLLSKDKTKPRRKDLSEMPWLCTPVTLHQASGLETKWQPILAHSRADFFCQAESASGDDFHSRASQHCTITAQLSFCI